MPKFVITQHMRGPVDKAGQRSDDNEVVDPSGRHHVQMFHADPASTLARLRHNIAHQFWFDRMRLRLAPQASQVPS